VPCPTTILTLGLLLAVEAPPVWVAIIPVLWAGVGGSAAVLLGVQADFVLLAAGGLLVTFMVQSNRSRPAFTPRGHRA
jgi:hypothetical protein